MGYEIKLHIGEVLESGNGKGAKCFMDHAMVDLCKVGHGKISELDAQKPAKPQVYLYATNGNTRIMRDCYSNCLRLHDAETVLEALEADQAAEPYRRYEMAIGLLKAAIPRFDNLQVAFYGH